MFSLWSVILISLLSVHSASVNVLTVVSVIVLSLLSVHSASVNVLTVVCDFNLFAVSA